MEKLNRYEVDQICNELVAEMEEKNYVELDGFEFWWYSLSDAVTELQNRFKKGELVKYDWNGTWLYSDTVTMDGAFKEITGMTKAEYDEWIKSEHDRKVKEEEAHKAAIPELTKEWIEKGHKILREPYWKHWDEIVPARLQDLYWGMELGCCLDIIECLQTDHDFEKAKKIFENQGHSGLSASLVASMVSVFCNEGAKFAAFLGFGGKR